MHVSMGREAKVDLWDQNGYEIRIGSKASWSVFLTDSAKKGEVANRLLIRPKRTIPRHDTDMDISSDSGPASGILETKALIEVVGLVDMTLVLVDGRKMDAIMAERAVSTHEYMWALPASAQNLLMSQSIRTPVYARLTILE